MIMEQMDNAIVAIMIILQRQMKRHLLEAQTVGLFQTTKCGGFCNYSAAKAHNLSFCLGCGPPFLDAIPHERA